MLVAVPLRDPLERELGDLLFADPLRDDPLDRDELDPERDELERDRDELDPPERELLDERDRLLDDERLLDERRRLDPPLRSAAGISSRATAFASCGICFSRNFAIRSSSRRMPFASFAVSLSPTDSASASMPA